VRINDVERMIKKKSRKSILDRFESQKSASIASDDSKILLSSDPMDASCLTILAPSPPMTFLSSPGNYGLPHESLSFFSSELNPIDLTIGGFMTKRCFLEEGEDL
jgi:hypothetical protein